MLAFMLNDFDALRAEGAASRVHPQWAALAARAADASALAPLAGGGEVSAVTELRRKLEALERTVNEQQKRIDELGHRDG
jgi:hypothetical protein